MGRKKPSPISVCFVAPLCYPLFNKAYTGPFGGWEVRVSILAKELAKSGEVVVHLIVADHGQAHLETIDLVRLISWKGRWLWGQKPMKGANWLITIMNQLKFFGVYGIPKVFSRLFVVRGLHKLLLLTRLILTRNPFAYNSPAYRTLDRFQSHFRQLIHLSADDLISLPGNYSVPKDFMNIFAEVDSDVYIVPGNTELSAEIAYFCKKNNKKYVFLAGSDHDFYPEYKEKPEGKDLYGVPHELKLFSIEQADLHVVQNQAQADMLKNVYGRDSVLLRNPIDLRKKFNKIYETTQILWIGKSDPRVKRPHLFLELAKRMPDLPFFMVLNKAKLVEFRENMLAIARLPNVTAVEQISFQEIERLFAESKLHINTSSFEGFPNTFLQSAKYGVPTVSMVVDPGGMLSTHHCGVVSGENMDNLVSVVRSLLDDDSLYKEYSENCISYVSKYHDVSAISKRFLKIIADLVSTASR